MGTTRKELKNIDKMRGGVHIAVQGYEVDRITEVPILRRAEKVYLICMNEDKDSEIGKSFKEIITKLFKENNISFEIKYVDLFDLEELIRNMKSIITSEREQYGDVKFYINISSGSTMGCIAGMTCAMMLNKDNSKIIPYYVIPEYGYEHLPDGEKEKYMSKYGDIDTPPRTYGVRDVKFIYPFKVNLPREELLIFLKCIELAGDRGLSIKELVLLTKEKVLNGNTGNSIIDGIINNDNGITKYDLEKIVKWRRSGMVSSKPSSHSDIVWINKNVIEKLLEWELIKEPEKIGRSRYVRISENGKMLLDYGL